MQSTSEQAQETSKRLAVLVQDEDSGVRNQAAFSTVRLGQRLAEKLHSPELEKSLVLMISKELETKYEFLPQITWETKIAEGERRKRAVFIGPCLYSGIQALGEIRATTPEAFDLLKKLLQSENKNVRWAAAYAMATIDRSIEETLKVLQDRQKAETDEIVKEFIQGSIAVLIQHSQPSGKTGE